MKVAARAAAVLTVVAQAVLFACPAAQAAPAARVPSSAEIAKTAESAEATETVAPGVTYRAFKVPTPRGDTRMHELAVVPASGGPHAELLYPGTVAARSTVSRMVGARNAVAGVNGDFFHVEETQHPGVPATGSPTGPAVVDGSPLKGAVPLGQRYGPRPPPGATPEDVFGVGTDGVARLDRLTLSGTVKTPTGPLAVGGLNQYALPVGAVGVFDSRWGATSRARAVCGTDTSRAGACSTDVQEVAVRDGKVEAVSAAAGSGAIPPGTMVLLGRDAGARALRALAPGTPVQVDYDLAAASGTRFAFALGVSTLIRGGSPLAGLDAKAAAPRTAVCVAADGHGLRLLATDGRGGRSAGLTLSELAAALRPLGCADAGYLDGGGSVTMATRDGGTGKVAVRNTLDGGAEREVPNGIAVFAGQ
ncbi:phosphodiester glycosidase family protein [Yinghuangia seranimata]|uniref:phosphodiester glycosidase family protein n=1 Tax=Yinghuangia seranimata TaxID=408067 RepID=UPI00248C0E9C|nr:phosphodiester glycosidase family protein [Yinghuangia seranimata]MDI2130640.1 phosphodiester glycosidase family protein [Yinghuangia seranimata]